ncbi:hypothetical protein PENTCL1PPCAC_13871, partial [Pristionchus entomophagus]
EDERKEEVDRRKRTQKKKKTKTPEVDSDEEGRKEMSRGPFPDEIGDELMNDGMERVMERDDERMKMEMEDEERSKRKDKKRTEREKEDGDEEGGERNRERRRRRREDEEELNVDKVKREPRSEIDRLAGETREWSPERSEKKENRRPHAAAGEKEGQERNGDGRRHRYEDEKELDLYDEAKVKGEAGMEMVGEIVGFPKDKRPCWIDHRYGDCDGCRAQRKDVAAAALNSKKEAEEKEKVEALSLMSKEEIIAHILRLETQLKEKGEVIKEKEETIETQSKTIQDLKNKEVTVTADLHELAREEDIDKVKFVLDQMSTVNDPITELSNWMAEVREQREKKEEEMRKKERMRNNSLEPPTIDHDEEMEVIVLD